MKSTKSKSRNPFATSAKSRKADKMVPRSKKRQNGTNKQKERLQEYAEIMEEDSERDPDLMSWYVGPLTVERLATLRYKLAKARGLLRSFIDWEIDEDWQVPSTQDVIDTLKETEDP